MAEKFRLQITFVSLVVLASIKRFLAVRVFMQVFRPSFSSPNSSYLLLLVGFLLCLYLPQAAAFLNRSYTTLEQSIPLKGDFDNIIRSGKLRILLTQDFTSVTYLPRRRSALAEQQRMAEEFALSHGLIPELVIVNNFSELIPALVA